MRYDHTEVQYIKRHPDTGVYYFKRGSVEESLKTRDWKEAKLRGEIRVNEIDSAGSLAFKFTVAELVKNYIRERKKSSDIREVTKAEIETMFENHLLPYFGKMKLYKVSPVTWRAYTEREKRDYANHRKVMRGFLMWCVERGFLAGMPDIMRLPKHKRRTRRVIKDDELMRIFKHAKGNLRMFLALALYNGLRRSEIMKLRWDGVSFKEKFITIESESNKLDRERRLPINATIMRMLGERHMASGGISPWVFPNANDRMRHADVRGLKTAWHTCLKNAGIEVGRITWHDFRATYEKHAHKSKDFTDTQKEKFADSSSEVQKRLYVSMDHDDLRGLESVVKVEGLDELIFDTGRTRGGNQQ